ncbi:MAG: hypothetical protein KJ811_04920, partial [Candidatus Margulisbacteria bacterium]|nr:hypothetical protein [Candidatus Margulisiibacteriota bacterium]
MRTKIIFVIWFLSLASNSLAGILDWQVYETADFTLFYPQGYEQKASETLHYLEKYQLKIKKLTGNNQQFKTRVILQDPGLMANGYADSLNYKIGIFSNAPAAGFDQSWLRKVAVHELIHMNQLTNVSGQARLNTTIFGNSFSPNVNIPMWLLEGITVYGESQLSPYEGRLSSGYFDAIMAAKAQADQLPSPLQANYNNSSYPQGSYYLYGGAFVRFLADQYGEESLARFFKLFGYYYWIPYVGSLYPAYGIDDAAWCVYGKTFPRLFAEWHKYEKTKALSWKIKGERIKKGPGYSLAKDLNDLAGKLVYVRQDYLFAAPFDYNSHRSIIEFDPKTGQERVVFSDLAELIGSVQKVEGSYYCALVDVVPNYPNVDLDASGFVALVYELDQKSNQKRFIFKDELNDFVVMPGGKIIYVKEQKSHYGSEIWEFKAGEKRKIAEVDQLIGELKPYGDKFIVSAKHQLGSWNISKFDINTLAFEPIVKSPWHEVKIKVVENKLYFTANYDKRLSIYEYDLLSGQLVNLTDSSYASDGLVVDDKLYFVGVENNGEYVYEDRKPRSLNPTPMPDEQVSSLSLEPLSGESALSRNLSYFLMPSTRFFPALAIGQDGLGYNQYGIFYGTDGGLDFMLFSKMFLPVYVSYSNVFTVDQRKNYLTLTLPAYYSYRAGLSAVLLMLKTDFEETMPGVMVDYAWPNYKVSSLAQSDISDGGVSLDLSQRYLFSESSFNLSLSGYRDFDRIRNVRGLLRSSINNTTGYGFDLSYSHRLLKLQQGLWSPNVFVGDIYGGPFAQYSNTNTNVSAYGLELGAEVGIGFWINFVPKVGVSVVDGKSNYYF